MGEIRTTLTVIRNRSTLRSSETSDVAIATRRQISGDGILHSHRRENLKSYTYEAQFSHKYCIMCIVMHAKHLTC
jgi:hypothetical protein